MIKIILLFPKTYRFDIFLLVFLLSFYSFDNNNVFQTLALAFFFSLIPFNFIYTINILTDKKEDSINKPKRIKLINDLGGKNIRNYSIFLFFLGIMIPIVYFSQKILILSIIVMTGGIIYSIPPFRAKRNISGNIVVLIVALSILLNRPEGLDKIFLLNFIFYAFLMMAFKDINDTKGDKEAKVFNWFNLRFPIWFLIYSLNITIFFTDIYFKSYLLSVFAFINLFLIKIKFVKKNYIYFICIFLSLIIFFENDLLKIKGDNMGRFEIVYFYQNCFLIKHGEEGILFDVPDKSFIEENVFSLIDKISPENINLFFSHGHSDHFTKDLSFFKDKKLRIFVPENIKIDKKDVISLKTDNDSFKDKDLKVSTIKSNDEGMAYILEWKGLRIYFGGDLASWYWEGLSKQEFELYVKYFFDTVENLKKKKPFDIVFSNADNRVRDLSGAKDIMDALRPGLFVPMHLFGNIDILKQLPDKTNIFKYKKSGDSMVFEKH